jgi:predicted MFS family arabinose efflux permease
MLVTRALQGAFIAPFIGVASTLLSSLARPGGAGRAIGQMNIGTVVGTVFAVPAVVALADGFGWQPVTMSVGVLALLVAPVIAHNLRGLPAVPATPWRRQLAILQRSRFLAHLSVSVLLFTSMFVSYSYIAALLEGPLALSQSGVAVAMCAFGVAGIAGNHLASNRVGRRPLALTNVIAAFLVVIGAAMTALIDYRLVALALLLPWGAAYTAAFVACQVRVMFAAQDAPAFAASLNIAACNLGIAIGAFIGGWVVEQFGVAGVGLAAGVVGLGALTFGVLLAVPPASGAGVCEMEESFPPSRRSAR